MVTIASWVVEGRSNVWGGGGKIPNLTNIFPMGWNHQLECRLCCFRVSENFQRWTFGVFLS